MKLIYLLFPFLLISCTSGIKNESIQTIQQYVETDKQGRKYDFKFKVLDWEKIGEVTVQDSLNILTDLYKKDREFDIRKIELINEAAQMLLESETKSRWRNDSKIDNYQKTLQINASKIDSLRNSPADNLKKYNTKNPDDVLAVIIRCTYSIVPPLIGTAVEESFDFVLSPDGRRVYDLKRVK